MNRQNVACQISEGVYQLSLFVDPIEEKQEDRPLGGPSALEKASWSNQFQPAARQLLLNEPVTEKVMLFHIGRSEWGQKLFDWGTAHDYPEFHLRIDGRVVAVIAQGRSEWIRFCTVDDGFLMSQVCWQLKHSQCRPKNQPIGVDHQPREAIMAFGRQRGWNYCLLNHAAIPERNQTVMLFIGSGEKNWSLFANGCDAVYVVQMLSMLRRHSYTLSQFREPRPIVLHSELAWRFFCAHERFEYITSAYGKIRGTAL